MANGIESTPTFDSYYELATQPPTRKVGDRVRVVKIIGFRSHIWESMLGNEYTITYVRGQLCKLDSPDPDSFWIPKELGEPKQTIINEFYT